MRQTANRGIISPFPYAAEKFAAARRSLMLPHTAGEARSIASAFHECLLGLKDIRSEDLDDNASMWVAKIQQMMDVTGIEDPLGVGTWEMKARQLSDADKIELRNSVDELAFWFDRQ
jgi:hypothetical protein